MRPQPPDVTLDQAIGIFIIRELHPDLYARAYQPWEALARKPTWRHAKGLMREHPERVSALVEHVVGSRSGRSDSEAFMCLAKVRLERRDYERALEVFEELADRGQAESYKYVYNVGLCLAALGRVREARDAFSRVLDVRPNDDRAKRALAEISP
jgi:tetratricopeptide (TPR) repeat protein